MIGALHSVLIERGLDPRDFTLCAFGGATPLHASSLMREMGIPRAIVPIHPAQFSAYGFILTDARVDRQRTTQLTSKRFEVEVANRILDELVAESVLELEGQGYRDDIEIQRGLEMRYLGQNYELELPVPFARFDEATTEALWQRFHEAHEARFGFAIPGEIIEIVTYTVTAIAPTPKPEPVLIGTASGPPVAQGAPPGAVRRRGPRGAGVRAQHALLRPDHPGPGADRGGRLGDRGRGRPPPAPPPGRPPADRRGGRLRPAGQCLRSRGAPKSATPVARIKRGIGRHQSVWRDQPGAAFSRATRRAHKRAGAGGRRALMETAGVGNRVVIRSVRFR